MQNIGLKDKNLYYIGGIVRDEILGLNSLDIDLTYQGDAIAKFSELKECIKINKDFGTVRLLVDGKEIDIASTRDEKYTHKGHLPEVFDIGCDLKKDVLRRDFTINALAKSTLTNEIIDYTGGLNDIKEKRLRVLHDNSFIDDPTRIIRGLKFSVRFGFELDEHTKELQDEYLNNINYDMSYKRLKKEIVETFNLNSQKAFNKFINQKIYKLLGEYEINPPQSNIEELVNKYPVNNIWLVYTGWLQGITNLPLTKEEQKIIDDYKELVSNDIEDDDFDIYKAFHLKSKESVLLYAITVNSKIALRYFEIANIHLNISGEDLKSIGIAPSKKYSDCFDYVLKSKLSNPEMTKTDELELVNSFFNLL